MPRFFFNFRDGKDVSPDDLGIECASIENAYLAAFQAATDIWRDRLAAQRNPLDCAFEIGDEAGNTLLVLPFQEVLDACRRPAGGHSAFAETRRLRAQFEHTYGALRSEWESLQATLNRTRELLGPLP
jgi:hypothetical protein